MVPQYLDESRRMAASLLTTTTVVGWFTPGKFQVVVLLKEGSSGSEQERAQVALGGVGLAPGFQGASGGVRLGEERLRGSPRSRSGGSTTSSTGRINVSTSGGKRTAPLMGTCADGGEGEGLPAARRDVAGPGVQYAATVNYMRGNAIPELSCAGTRSCSGSTASNHDHLAQRLGEGRGGRYAQGAPTRAVNEFPGPQGADLFAQSAGDSTPAGR